MNIAIKRPALVCSGVLPAPPRWATSLWPDCWGSKNCLIWNIFKCPVPHNFRHRRIRKESKLVLQVPKLSQPFTSIPLWMLPNSRKIPTVPSATSYQTEPTPLIQQDAMQRSPASSSSGLAPPTASNASKSSNFFSRFTRRRSQSTAAVTPKHFPAPSASISTLNSKASQSSASTIPHQPIPVTPTSVPKVQRKPIAAEPASSKNLQSSTTNSKSSYRPSTRDSASRSSTSKPVVKKVQCVALVWCCWHLISN